MAQALEVRKQLQPVITIPMHYRTPALGLGGFFFAQADDFVSLSGEPVKKAKDLSIDLDTVKADAGLILLKYD